MPGPENVINKGVEQGSGGQLFSLPPIRLEHNDRLNVLDQPLAVPLLDPDATAHRVRGGLLIDPENTVWSPLHQKALDAVEASLLLAPLKEALSLPSTSSERADQALVVALLRDSQSASALGKLRRGDHEGFAQALWDRYPTRLSPEVVHHLALMQQRASSYQAQRQGLRGLLWIWDRHPSYFKGIAARSAEEPGRDTSSDVEETLSTLPRWLLAPYIEQLQSLGTDVVNGGLAAQRAWETLNALIEASQTDALSDEASAALEALREEVIDEAIRRCCERCEVDLHRVEAEAAQGRYGDVGEAFEAAQTLQKEIGDATKLSLWVVERANKTAWDLYRGKQLDALARFLAPVLPFASDLAEKLEAGECFGHQSTFADFTVLWSEPPMPDETRQVLLLRAHALCPEHRNTRVCLSTSYLRTARKLLREATLTWPATRLFGAERARTGFDRAEALIKEIQRLRPDHERLDELQELLKNTRQRLGLANKKKG